MEALHRRVRRVDDGCGGAIRRVVKAGYQLPVNVKAVKLLVSNQRGNTVVL